MAAIDASREQLVLIDASGVFTGLAPFSYDLSIHRKPGDYEADIHADARSRAVAAGIAGAAGQAYYDANGKPTAKLTTSADADFDYGLTFLQQGLDLSPFEGDARTTIKLASR